VTTNAIDAPIHNKRTRALAGMLARVATFAVVLGLLPTIVGPVYGLEPAMLREAPWWHFGLWFGALAGAGAALGRLPAAPG
jgi:hypothetical protein